MLSTDTKYNYWHGTNLRLSLENVTLGLNVEHRAGWEAPDRSDSLMNRDPRAERLSGIVYHLHSRSVCQPSLRQPISNTPAAKLKHDTQLLAAKPSLTFHASFMPSCLEASTFTRSSALSILYNCQLQPKVIPYSLLTAHLYIRVSHRLRIKQLSPAH